MRLRSAIAILVVLVVPAFAVAQTRADTRVDAIFSAYSASTPGCALGVVHEGKFVYEKGYGQASLELGVPKRR